MRTAQAATPQNLQILEQTGGTHGHSSRRLTPVAPRAQGEFHRHGVAGPDHHAAGAGAAANRVAFEPGARTAWHTHPLGQTLYIISGVGRIQTKGQPVREIKAGDVVWIPPGEKHWHGGAPTTGMVHIAMQESLDGNHATWLEQVTDEEYSAALG